VGAGVGAGEGTAVGSAVGAGDGAGVGVAVGAGDGTAVGSAVGAGDGAGEVRACTAVAIARASTFQSAGARAPLLLEGGWSELSEARRWGQACIAIRLEAQFTLSQQRLGESNATLVYTFRCSRIASTPIVLRGSPARRVLICEG